MTGNPEFKSLSGLAFFERVRDGLIDSPMVDLFGLKLEEVFEGISRLSVMPSEKFNNHMGRVHGGFAATLLDTALGVAAHTKLPVELSAVTIDLKVSFVRAITADKGQLTAHGRVLHFGRTLITAEGELVDAGGKLFATATASFLAIEK